MNPVVMIDIDKINILNPRYRNKRVFADIADNIVKVGLKRPVTVTPSRAGIPGKDYDLVCGQGRVEAFQARDQKQIPAVIVDAGEEQALLMSLVENIARRKHRAVDLMQTMEIMKRQGYSAETIGAKTGLATSYIYGILHLLSHGEERLVAAVEAGKMPIGVAMRISASPEAEIQNTLRELYESKQLRGRKLFAVRRIVDIRRSCGKSYKREAGSGRSTERTVSANDIMRVFKRETARKRLLTKKAEVVNSHLVFVAEALKRLFKEEHFTTLLKAEGLTTLPKPMHDIIRNAGE